MNEGAGFNGTDGNIGVAASVVAGVGVGVTVELGVCVDVVPLTTLGGGGVTVGFTVGEGVGTGFSAGVGEGVGAAVRGGGAAVCVCGGAALTMRGRVLVGEGVGFTDCASATSGDVKASAHTDTILVSKVGWFFIKLQASQVG
ncbi:MAG: hypothetical protein M3R15_14340 [Acidobacteriota bacterium]|nr:hypothetical protein [Acidobacteriota bacterium]